MRDSQWQDLSPVELEREYSPSSCLVDGDYRPYVAEYRRASDAAWAQLIADPQVSTRVLTYGDSPSRTVDLAVPDATDQPRPLLAFIHGGYWQELSKLDSRFAAKHAVDQGLGFAAVDYTLAPQATLDQIVTECHDAVAALADVAIREPRLGLDPDRIVVAGSSAGAHLAAMVGLASAAGDGARVAATVLVSGVFDLEPIVATSINDALGLDGDSARLNSPLRHDARGFPPTLVAYGTNETEQFKAQSDRFACHLSDSEVPVRSIEIAGRNHFDVIDDLAAPDSPLGDAVAELIGSLKGQKRPPGW